MLHSFALLCCRCCVPCILTKWGRADAKSCNNSNSSFPSGAMGSKAMFAYFRQNFNFTPTEVVLRDIVSYMNIGSILNKKIGVKIPIRAASVGEGRGRGGKSSFIAQFPPNVLGYGVPPPAPPPSQHMYALLQPVRKEKKNSFCVPTGCVLDGSPFIGDGNERALGLPRYLDSERAQLPGFRVLRSHDTTQLPLAEQGHLFFKRKVK
jgi:hypothetical protein